MQRVVERVKTGVVWGYGERVYVRSVECVRYAVWDGVMVVAWMVLEEDLERRHGKSANQSVYV